MCPTPLVVERAAKTIAGGKMRLFDRRALNYNLRKQTWCLVKLQLCELEAVSAHVTLSAVCGIKVYPVHTLLQATSLSDTPELHMGPPGPVRACVALCFFPQQE